ncbi:MAG TPA: tetratricopeptide repeat protein, partial [bacterium]|nr:tetratricopeptide repeat protein [bacterium]
MRAFQTQSSANYQKAALVLNKALALDPDNLIIHERLASVYERQGNTRSAAERMQFIAHTAKRAGNGALLEKTLLKLVDLLPDDPEVLQQMAHFRTKQGQLREAVVVLENLLGIHERQGALPKIASTCEQILALEPQRSDIREKLIGIQEEKGSQKEVLAERRALAESLVEQGNLQDALQQFRLILSVEPEDIAVLERMAELSDRTGLKEQSHDGYVKLASLAAQPEQALQIYQKAVQTFATKPRTWQKLAECAEATGQKDVAVAAFEKASQLFLDTSEPVLAEKCLRKVRELAPDSQRAREMLIRLLKSQGKRGEALEELLDLAGILREKGETTEACRLYQEAHSENPDSLAAAFQLGEVYQETGQTQAFCQLYEKLGAQRSAEGDLEGSLDLYKRLLGVDPDNVDALQGLATTLRAMGDTKQAVLNVRRLAEILCAQAQDSSAEAVRPLLLSRARQCLWDAIEWASEDADLHCQMAAVEALRGDKEQAARILVDFCKRSLLKFRSEETQTGEVAAKETFEKLLAQTENIVGDSPLVHEMRSEVNSAFGQIQEAAQDLLNAGDLHQKRGNPAAALLDFERARNVLPDSDQPLERIFALCKQRGDANAAVAAAWQLAKRFRDRSQGEALDQMLGEIAVLTPSDARVHEWLVLSALESGQQQKAIEKALLGADALIAQQHFQEAVVLCRTAREKIGLNPTLSEKIMECLVQRQDIRGAIAEATDLATQYQQEGVLDRAIALYQRAITWEPRNTVLRKSLAEQLASAGRIDDAKREWLELAGLYTQSGLAEKAVEVLRGVRNRFAQDFSIRHQLVQLLLKEGMNRSAAQEGSALLDEIWGQIQTSEGDQKRGLLQESRQLAEQVLAANPDLGDIVAVYAEILFCLGDESAYADQKIRQATLLRETNDYTGATNCLQES